MAFQVSPGVLVQERDLTNIIPAVSTSIGAMAGAFSQGPIDEIISISSEQELVDTFGKPDSTNFETFFTAGPNEIKAWTIKSGSLAPNAAGVIHTDFERGFIKAEVIDYDDFIECSGEQGAKEKGKLRLEGKEYIVKDGDIIHFKFNV